MGHFLYISPFQSTLPVWGGTRAVCETFRAIHDFNPPSPCGEGLRHVVADVHILAISIHPPRVGRDPGSETSPAPAAEISIHPPRVGRDPAGGARGPKIQISIHPPRVGRDACYPALQPGTPNFNPPSPCGEGPGPVADGERQKHFNPPSPCGEGPVERGANDRLLLFQSTLPVWGGTGPKMQKTVQKREFQSTLPVWGGTGMPAISLLTTSISIHPPRVGRDSKSSQKFFVNFCARR